MNRQEWINGFRRGFAAAWIIGIAIALKIAASTATEIRAGLLIALAILGYLAAWGLAFGLARDGGKRGSLLIGCALCTVSIGFTVGLVELPGCLDLIDYRVAFSTPAPAWNRSGNAPDRDLLFVHEGHQTLRWRFQGNDIHRLKGMSSAKVYSNELHLDANGFRNAGDPGFSEIVLIGDSFIEGPHTGDDHLVSRLLIDKTGQPSTNFGRSGYGPIQELSVLERFALPLKPKEVVWAFYEGNDLADIREYPAARERLVNEKPPTLASRAFDRSFLNNGLEFVIRSKIRPEATRDPGQYLGHFESHTGENVSIYFSSDDYNPNSGPRARSPEFQQFGEILDNAIRLCKENGARLTVVFIPTKWRVYRNDCGFEPNARCLLWELDDLPTAFETLITSRSPNANFLDLTPGFQKAAEHGRSVYLADDTHWSDEGHELAAKLIAEAIKAKASIPAIDSRTRFDQ